MVEVCDENGFQVKPAQTTDREREKPKESTENKNEAERENCCSLLTRKSEFRGNSKIPWNPRKCQIFFVCFYAFKLKDLTRVVGSGKIICCFMCRASLPPTESKPSHSSIGFCSFFLIICRIFFVFTTNSIPSALFSSHFFSRSIIHFEIAHPFSTLFWFFLVSAPQFC